MAQESMTSNGNLGKTTLRLVPSEGLHHISESGSDTTSSNTTETSLTSSDHTPLFDLIDAFCSDPIPVGDQEDELELGCRIMHLVAEIMPKLDVPFPPTIEDLGRGSYNRVLGITIKSKDPRQASNSRILKCLSAMSGPRTQALQFALRISLHEPGLFFDMAADIANLRLANSRLPRLVPRLIDYDLKQTNALGKAYILQERVRGENLNFLWNDLNAHQRMSAMYQIIKVTEEIANVTAPAAGLISSENLVSPGSSNIDLVRFAPPQLEKFRGQPAPPQSPLEFMLQQCDHWIEYERSSGMTENALRWPQIIAIVHSLHQRGWLGDRFHLAHNDLFPRNVIAAIKTSSTVEITGVIDWDMCYFAPKFVALRAPFWAWINEHESEHDEDNAASIPEDREGEIMKMIFHGTASKEFLRSAITAEGILARKLWQILMAGMDFEHYQDFATKVIEQWAALHPEDGLENIQHP
ncbi:hypothetical protein ACN47E_010138 [Coniothyrium glycines]